MWDFVNVIWLLWLLGEHWNEQTASGGGIRQHNAPQPPPSSHTPRSVRGLCLLGEHPAVSTLMTTKDGLVRCWIRGIIKKETLKSPFYLFLAVVSESYSQSRTSSPVLQNRADANWTPQSGPAGDSCVFFSFFPPSLLVWKSIFGYSPFSILILLVHRHRVETTRRLHVI